MECSAETFAYYSKLPLAVEPHNQKSSVAACLIVVFVDLMGQHFTLAVNVPYSMGTLTPTSRHASRLVFPLRPAPVQMLGRVSKRSPTL